MSALLPTQWLEWHPCAAVLLAGTDDGNMWMWKIPSGECKTFQSAASQATCGKVLPDGERRDNKTLRICLGVKKLNHIFFFIAGKRAVVGYEDGTVRVWDLKQGNAAHVIKGESSFFLLVPFCISVF